MHNSPFSQFFNRYWFFFVVAIGILILLILLFASPLSPFHRCTLIGCRDTLDLTLSHEPTSRYTVLLTDSAGEKLTVTCIPGKVSANSQNTAVCRTGIVTFYGLAPADLTIQITWQGGTYSITAHPEYTSFRPNGLFCPPTCQLGTLSLELP